MRVAVNTLNTQCNSLWVITLTVVGSCCIVH